MREPKTIFAGTDFSPLGDLAVRTAVDLAENFGAEHLHLVHAAPATQAWFLGAGDVPVSSFAAFDANIDALRRALDGLEVPVTTARVTRDVRIGPAARELAAAAEEIKADLGVVASHRRGRLGRFVLGSVASALVRASPCPIFVAGEDRRLRHPMRNVLAAIDGSPISIEVLRHAIAFAKKERGRVKLVSVFDVAPFGPSAGPTIERIERYHRETIAGLAERARISEVELDVSIHSHNNVKEVVLGIAETWPADLLVIGTSGHNAWERMMMGSTATRLLAEAHSPVLVVPTVANRSHRSEAA